MTVSEKVLITGATGFLGRHLADFFRREGYTVAGLARNPALYPFKEPDIRLSRFNLPDEINPEDFEGVGIVIHCAYTTKALSERETERVNIGGTRKVLELSRRAGVKKFVFISSTGATPEAESRYGKSKFRLESLFDPERDLIIRPGLIIGQGSDGSFNRMRASVSGLGLVPVFGGGNQVLQTVHVQDLCQAVFLCLKKGFSGVYVVAEPEGLTIREFFQKMAGMMGKKCTFIPLPLNLTLFGLKIIEKLGVPFPLSSENLLGLKHMVHMPSEKDLEKIGIQIKSAPESLKTVM